MTARERERHLFIVCLAQVSWDPGTRYRAWSSFFVGERGHINSTMQLKEELTEKYVCEQARCLNYVETRAAAAISARFFSLFINPRTAYRGFNRPLSRFTRPVVQQGISRTFYVNVKKSLQIFKILRFVISTKKYTTLNKISLYNWLMSVSIYVGLIRCYNIYFEITCCKECIEISYLINYNIC